MHEIRTTTIENPQKGTDKPLVTITGINGNVGSHVCLNYLKDGGYRVRGTVRGINDMEKLGPIKDSFGELWDELELVEMELSDDAQVDKAIEGATYVVHIAQLCVIGATYEDFEPTR